MKNDNDELEFKGNPKNINWILKTVKIFYPIVLVVDKLFGLQLIEVSTVKNFDFNNKQKHQIDEKIFS